MNLERIKHIYETYKVPLATIFIVVIFIFGNLLGILLSVVLPTREFFSQFGSEKTPIGASTFTNDINDDLSSAEGTVSNNYVDISGAVEKPGVYEITGQDRIIDIIKKAGGFDSNADIQLISQKINLSKKTTDSQKIYIPFVWDADAVKQGSIELTYLDSSDVSASVTRSGSLNMDSYTPSNEVNSDSSQLNTDNLSNKSDNNNKLDINTASKDEIDTLPGIGEKYAQKIIETRPYDGLQDMEARSGLSKSLISKISSLIQF